MSPSSPLPWTSEELEDACSCTPVAGQLFINITARNADKTLRPVLEACVGYDLDRNPAMRRERAEEVDYHVSLQHPLASLGGSHIDPPRTGNLTHHELARFVVKAPNAMMVLLGVEGW